MKKFSSALTNHISSEVTSLATCWKLKLTSGKIIGFTDCDINIDFEGINYKAQSGFTSSSVISTMNLASDNLEVEAALDDKDIKEEDILNGIYDYSEIEIFIINYLNPEQGCIFLNKGYLGEITIKQGKFIVEIKSETQKLDKLIGNLYSPICRAKFGDNYCKVNKALLAKKGKISTITSSYSFIDNVMSEKSGYFNFGIIEFTTGEYIGRKLEIKDFINKEFFLSLPIANNIKTGDEYFVIPGCDGSFTSCKNKYYNSLNFRGEPHIPGHKYMYSTSTTK